MKTGQTYEHEDALIADMRLFVVAKFSPWEFSQAGKNSKSKEGRKRNNGQLNILKSKKKRSESDTCVWDGDWEVKTNTYLEGYVQNCTHPEKTCHTFDSLAEAQEYFLECRQKPENGTCLKRWNAGGITKERNQVFTIRQGAEGVDSKSCEISWIYNGDL